MYTRMGQPRLAGDPRCCKAVAGRRVPRVEEVCWFYAVAVAAGIYVAANLIFVFSVSIPNSIGFESRTQGGIRFAVALLVAVTAMALYRLSEHTRLRRL